MVANVSASTKTRPDARSRALEGATAIVTGANCGIGYETARALAVAGAHVVLACRDEARAADAARRIRAETPAAAVDAMVLDLGDLASVRDFASEASRCLPRIDVLCNNAGVLAVPNKVRQHTHDGFELHFGVNHLGHFALTGLLLDKLAASAPSRVVTMTGLVYKFGARLRFDDLPEGGMHGDAYADSKLANLVFALELQRRLEAGGLDVRSVACHPGLVRSNLFCSRPDMVPAPVPLWLRLVGPLARPACVGARPEIHAASSEDVRGGDLIGPSGFMELRGAPGKVKPSSRAQDAAAARRLWAVSEQLTGVSYLD